MRVRTIGRKISAKYNFLRNFLHPPLIILSVPRSNYKTDLKNIPSLTDPGQMRDSLLFPFPSQSSNEQKICLAGKAGNF